LESLVTGGVSTGLSVVALSSEVEDVDEVDGIIAG